MMRVTLAAVHTAAGEPYAEINDVPLQELIDRFSSAVNGCLSVWDANMHRISKTEYFPEMQDRPLGLHNADGICLQRLLSKSVVPRKNNTYHLTKKSVSVLSNGREINSDLFICHIMNKGRRVYSILIITDSNQGITFDSGTLEYIFETIEKKLVSFHTDGNYETVFESFVRDVLEGKYSDRSSIEIRARELGLDIEAEYIFYFIEFKSDAAYKAQFFIEGLRQPLPNEPMIIFDNHVCILKNINAYRCSTDITRNRFKDRLSEYDAMCGLSRRTDSLIDCRRAYLQAVSALSFGKREITNADRHDRLFFYKDFSRFHSLELYSQRVGNIDSILPGNVIALYKDSENDPQNAEMLDAYIRNGMSTSSAADSLNVHRNTVIYRIKRIKDIFGVDLNDKDSLAGVISMLDIMEYKKRFGEFPAEADIINS